MAKRLNNPFRSLIYVQLFLILISFGGCQLDQDDFKNTPAGLSYKFYHQNKAGIGVLKGDKVTVDVVFRTADTVFFVSSRDLTVPYQFEVLEPRFQGDLYDALMLMAVGDSATFILNGDSLFILDFEIQELPDFIRPDTKVFMDVKLQDVMPKDEFTLEKEAYQGRVNNLLNELQEKETADIHAYLKQHDIHTQPTASGLYFIELEKGNGPSVEAGKSIKVNYTAMFINGEIFETSLRDIAMKNNIFDSANSYQPFQYQQGDSITIAGWSEGLSYMKQGGRALLIVPSFLAYGEEGVEGLIPPYTPLIYEVNVLEVN